MPLSVGAKQNILYILFVIITAVGTIWLYQFTQQDWILFREAETRFANKEFAEAIALYHKGLEAGLPFSKVELNLAHSYVAVGKFKEAIAIYKNYLLNNPQSKDVRLAFARVLSYNGNFDESDVEYQKVLENVHDQEN